MKAVRGSEDDPVAATDTDSFVPIETDGSRSGFPLEQFERGQLRSVLFDLPLEFLYLLD
ncbi:hypothetical protein [Haladaptatus caseinilyticus]|uniref:hypothetical protein n=1 Tax=Haladaptatus caseinilyticus TaxID=2993314 RepID=UPI00224A8763|nr:hypothetical protein [Haladaptatus caseinilyticus]